MEISDIDLSFFPLKLSVDKVGLRSVFSRILISKNKELNLAHLFNPIENELEREKQDQHGIGSTKIDIKKISVEDGHIFFSDRSIVPNFDFTLKRLGVAISGLDTNSAMVNFEGINGDNSPFFIKGKINPLTKEPFADLQVSCLDIALPRFTPYAAKYIGYTIEKGKLGVNMNVKVDGSHLSSLNRFFLNHLSLGKPVQSKDAINAPVALGISLLQDSQGNFSLNLPVSGDLKDPKFKISQVVVTMMTNIILKAVTSPFAILGLLVGAGEELGTLAFDPGEYIIKPEQKQKLDKLIIILDEKKELNLGIKGIYDPELDAAALAETACQLKAVKLEEVIHKGKNRY